MSNVTRYVMTWNRDKESTDEYAGRNLGGTRAQKDAEAAKQYMIERGWAKEEDFQSGKLNEAQEKAIYAIAQTQYRMSYLKQKAGGDPFAKYGSVDDFSKAVFDKETGKSELSTVIAEKKGSQEWYGKAFEKLSKKLEEDNKQ
jgi:hypothetical protein